MYVYQQILAFAIIGTNMGAFTLTTAVYVYLQTQIKAEVNVHEKVTLMDLILSVGYAV